MSKEVIEKSKTFSVDKMAKIIQLNTFTDKRGSLTVIEDFPFSVERIFYIYGVDDSIRGKHRHHQTRQLLFALKGSCTVFSNNGAGQKDSFTLDNPTKGLLLEPEDWHYMHQFTSDCILQVLASRRFEESDYIFEPYDQGDLLG